MSIPAIQLPASYRRQVLVTVQWVVLLALLLALLVSFFVYSRPVSLVLASSALVVAVGGWLSRHGAEVFGAHLLLTTVLVLTTTLAMRGQGIHDVAFAVMPALLLLAGLVLPTRQYFLIVALALGSVLLVAGSTYAGWIQPTLAAGRQPALWGEAAVLMVILLAEAAMVLLFVLGLLRFFVESEQQRQAVLATHAALQAEVRERRQAEAAVRALNARLEQRVHERTADLQLLVDELNAFNYSVSHDLRAPLRAIAGFADAASESLDTDPDEARQFLAKVQTASVRMNGLIDDLLRLSRTSTQTVQWQPVVLDQLLIGVIDELPEPASTWVQFDHSSAHFAVAADAGLLRLALTNLLANAVKYSGQQKSPRIEVAVRRDTESVVISVRDNGIGFAADEADRLFKPFSRLDNAKTFDGSGIGLAIVRRVVERHHGKIWGESQLGQGACFSLALPLQATADDPR